MKAVLSDGRQQALADVRVQVVLVEGVDVESPPYDGTFAADELVVISVAEQITMLVDVSADRTLYAPVSEDVKW